MRSAKPIALLSLSTALLCSVSMSTQADDPAPSMERYQATIVQSADDASIVSTLQSRLAWHGNTAGIDIRVSSHKGVVSLSGMVPADSDKRVAVATALHTPGVVSVDASQLHIGRARQVSEARWQQPRLQQAYRMQL
ncbi:BON domain-containing protein [Halopseudomonas pachastrellae]|uniref:BON domain-containing protein n=1 Tax=Halopseudomonas pachastrellae TaxID=254161 RepID=UPI003D7E6FE4|tara:strand:- start:50 stop:460 length:411 start_codon:yes stop_codon:yes gene_type:complete